MSAESPAAPGELERLRGEIDRLDDRILEAINERARLARRIGTLKVGQAYRPEREAQVLRRVKERNPGPLSAETAALLFREIMSACLALERPITVAYLGPRATYAHQAAIQQFGQMADLIPAATTDAIFDLVEHGGAEYGVVPVENSNEGVVSHTLDLFVESPLTISASYSLISSVYAARSSVPRFSSRTGRSSTPSLSRPVLRIASSHDSPGLSDDAGSPHASGRSSSSAGR